MKNHCSECKFFKYEDADGLGYCDLWQECDVNRDDEACVEFEEKEGESEYERL